MPVVNVRVLNQDIRKIESEAVVVCFFEDVRPLKGAAGRLDWILCGSLSHLLLDKRLAGSAGDVALLTTQGKLPVPKLFLVGLGPSAEYTLAALGRAAHTAGASLVNAGVRSAVLEYCPPPDASDDAVFTALQYGLQEGIGERELSISLLAHDTASGERLSRLVQQVDAAPDRQPS